MRRSSGPKLVFVAMLALSILASAAVAELPAIGAGGLLHPVRRRVASPPPAGCEVRTFAGEGVSLAGWRCGASAPRHGAIVYLHGVADNRTSAAGVIARFAPRGFDVVAYDSRAHGESGGTACTYGFLEKHDLFRVVDTLEPGAIVLVGTSLGAAVALQEAAGDPRVTAIVAAETFSDLETIAAERAPFFFTAGTIARAFKLAEERGGFRVGDVSPRQAAAHITVPVLLIHGASDRDTRPEHSQRVFAALGGPKRLIVVPGAGHNGSLRPEVWSEIERWVDDALRVTPYRASGGTPLPR